MSQFFSIFGLVVIAANAAYSNLEPTTDKRITLILYLLGIVGAAVGRGYERLRALQNKPAVVAGVIAAGITALVSVDPTVLTFLSPGAKSLLVVIAGVIVTLGKSLIGWDEPLPPGWKDNALKCVPLLLLLSSLAAVGCKATQGAQQSNARKFIMLLSQSAHQTTISLQTTRTLVDRKLIAPQLGLTINDALARYNAANKAALAYLQSNLVFDANGKATFAPRDPSQAIQVLNDLAAGADLVLSDALLGGQFRYANEFRALTRMLVNVAQIAKQLRTQLQQAQSDTIEIMLDAKTSLLLRELWTEGRQGR